MDNTKTFKMQHACKILGPAYEKMKKLSGADGSKFDSSRDGLVKYLLNNGIKLVDDNPSKLYLNKLSPGCRTCISGTWSCLCASLFCTRDCFYCPQNRKNVMQEKFPFDGPFVFKTVNQYVRYLNFFEFNGVSFTGGDPFFAIDTVIKYIEKIRAVFGEKHYVWIYTNGDLVTEDNLKILSMQGLNEIRFDLSARNYDLEPVIMAVKYIDAVTVEIPVIPEDLKLLKRLLKKLERIGVKYLNAHQLMFTRDNRDALTKRNYTILHNTAEDEYFPVLESELAALELLNFAVKIRSKLGINYCSKYYKNRFQHSGRRRRFARLYKQKFDFITEAGYIRTLTVGKRKEMINQQDLAKFIASGESITVEYYNSIPDYKKTPFSRLPREKFLSCIIKNGKWGIRRRLVFKKCLKDNNEMNYFLKLFVENMDIEALLTEILERNKSHRRKRSRVIKHLHMFYDCFSDLEYIPRNIPDYY